MYSEKINMTEKNSDDLEKLVKKNPIKFYRGDFHLIFSASAAASVVGACCLGYKVASGRDIGIVAPTFSAVIPLACAIGGYKFPHLSADIKLSNEGTIIEYDAPSRYLSSIKFFSKGILFQAVPFAAGCIAGYFSR
jgi:hypothetical protein